MYKLAIFFYLLYGLVSAITVDELLDKMEDNEQAQTSRSEITQTTHKANGKKNISRLISYSKDKGDKGLMEYLAPKTIKGMKMLMLNEGDDIWVYIPRTGRTRKIASHQKNASLNGSDFSYDDLSTKDNREDYNIKIIGEDKKNGIDCYKLEMIAKDKKSATSKLIAWVDKEKYVTISADIYDEDGELWKVLTLSKLYKTGNYWMAKQIEMKNVLKESKTVMTIDKMESDIELDDKLFTIRNLQH